MKVSDAIKERRSTRHYSTKKVKWKDLTKVLESAIYAPMAGNIFSLRFVVVSEQKKKMELANYFLDQSFTKDATYNIVICSDLEQTKRMFHEFTEDYGKRQASAAIQNMLIQATELGLGTCWIGTFNENSIKSALKIPESIKVEGIIILGYPKHKEKAPHKADINNLTHFEKWGMPESWKEIHPDFWAGVRESRLEK